MSDKYHAFNDEVTFQVGQRVRVDIPEVPLEHRDIETGVIVAITTRFPTTASCRSIVYKIRFDGKGNYVKKENTLFRGMQFEYSCSKENLKVENHT